MNCGDIFLLAFASVSNMSCLYFYWWYSTIWGYHKDVLFNYNEFTNACYVISHCTVPDSSPGPGLTLFANSERTSVQRWPFQIAWLNPPVSVFAKNYLLVCACVRKWSKWIQSKRKTVWKMFDFVCYVERTYALSSALTGPDAVSLLLPDLYAAGLESPPRPLRRAPPPAPGQRGRPWVVRAPRWPYHGGAHRPPKVSENTGTQQTLLLFRHTHTHSGLWEHTIARTHRPARTPLIFRHTHTHTVLWEHTGFRGHSHWSANG